MNIKTSLCAAAFLASLCMPQIAYSEKIPYTDWDLERLKTMCVSSFLYPLTDKFGVFVISIGLLYDGTWIFGTTDTYLVASGLGAGENIRQYFSFSDGARYFLDMRLQGGTLTSGVEERFVDSLKRSMSFEIALNGKTIADLPLDDSDVAINALVDCAKAPRL